MSRKLLGTLGIMVAVQVAMCWGAATAQAQVHGMYTDKAVYEPGETVKIYASAPKVESLAFQMIRHGKNPHEVAHTPTVSVSPQPVRVGSFVQIDDLDLSGRGAFTLEGWWYPTLVGGDTSVVVGQGDMHHGAGIYVTEDGHLAGWFASSDGSRASAQIVDDTMLDIDIWHHMALSYDGATLRLYLDGQQVGSASAAGKVEKAGAPLRIGGGPDAPGDLTGVIDGRIDSWAVWPRALSATEIDQRRQRGQAEDDPAPAAGDVDLYLGFEDHYGSITDASHRHHHVRIVNHGAPRMVGVHNPGLALRLNHDQLVDAHWNVTATLKIPDDATSGLYSIQSPDPDFTLVRWPALQVAIVVRPHQPTDARIAVVVPVNTWNAYNAWPGYNFRGPSDDQDVFAHRRRTPKHDWTTRSGNNSAYQYMGDGVSHALFQGWHRPNFNTSVDTGTGYGFNLRAMLSRVMVTWLENQGIKYDLYTDWDLDDGRIKAADYKMIFFHGHTEYWTRAMLDNIRAFADAGGSFIFMSGNNIYWNIAQTGDHIIQETRKWPTFVRATSKGYNDRVCAISEELSGLWELIEYCHDDIHSPTLMPGTLFDIQTGGHPNNYGRWEVEHSDSWLWPDDVHDGDLVGDSPYDGIYTVGHEADTYDPERPPPGLAPGTSVQVLATGVDFPHPEYADHRRNMHYRPDCDEIEKVNAGEMEPSQEQNLDVTADTRAGSIIYYRHRGGGRVLTIGSTASVWALASHGPISEMVQTAIDCFANDQGCPAEDYHAPDHAADAGSGTTRTDAGSTSALTGDAGPSDAGSDGGSLGGNLGSSGAPHGGGTTADHSAGCGCTLAGRPQAHWLALLAGMLIGLAGWRRRAIEA